MKAHAWEVTPTEARAIQEKLAGRVRLEDDFGTIHAVAGIDVGFMDRGKTARAAAVLLTFPGLEVIESAVAHEPTRFPYVPGLLSFRECPVALAALEKLDQVPDLLVCDGQGIAHPRRLGVACHLGLLTGIPAVGAAKSRLIGTFETPGSKRGDRTPLLDGEERIGTVLRTRANVKPLFVSPGHRVSMETAADLVLACAPRFRLPETTRQADRLASRR